MADDSKKKALAEAKKRSEAQTKEHYDRVEGTQPTPTQEENDRAKLGFGSVEELDDKEDDGSPEEKSTAPAGAAPYSTRDVKPK